MGFAVGLSAEGRVRGPSPPAGSHPPSPRPSEGVQPAASHPPFPPSQEEKEAIEQWFRLARALDALPRPPGYAWALPPPPPNTSRERGAVGVPGPSPFPLPRG